MDRKEDGSDGLEACRILVSPNHPNAPDPRRYGHFLLAISLLPREPARKLRRKKAMATRLI